MGKILENLPMSFDTLSFIFNPIRPFRGQLGCGGNPFTLDSATGIVKTLITPILHYQDQYNCLILKMDTPNYPYQQQNDLER
jgi:hypothetical protein